MSTKITYNGKTTELADGYIATLPCKDLKMETDVVVEAPEPVESGGEVLPDHTDSDFTLHYTSKGSGELGVSYSSTEKVSVKAAPSGAELGSFYDPNFVPSNIKKDVEIFGITGEFVGASGGGSLEAPTISLDGSILSITDNNADTKSFDIYADGVFVANVAKGETVDLTTLKLAEGERVITAKSLVQSGASNSLTYTATRNWREDLIGTWVLPSSFRKVTAEEWNNIFSDLLGLTVYFPNVANTAHQTTDRFTCSGSGDGNGFYAVGISVYFKSWLQFFDQGVFKLDETYKTVEFREDYSTSEMYVAGTEERMVKMLEIIGATKDTTTDTQALNIITEGE